MPVPAGGYGSDVWTSVSLVDVKNHLNITPTVTVYDDELRAAMDCAADVIEGIVGKVARQSSTQVYSGDGIPALFLRNGPVASITSVTEDGSAVAADGYSLSVASDILYRVAGYADARWSQGRNNISIVQVSGYIGEIPGSIIDCYKELIRINFRPQLGGNYSPFDTGATESGSVRLGFFVPNRILQVLEAHGIAPPVG